MQVPEVFYHYCSFLGQDALILRGPTMEEAMAGALRIVKREQWPQLRAFIEELLIGPYSEADLMKIIRSTYADITPRGPDGARKFLTFLRFLIDASGTISPEMLRQIRAHVTHEPLLRTSK
jgi:hypothetical protein